jgi:hypothetical protein
MNILCYLIVLLEPFSAEMTTRDGDGEVTPDADIDSKPDTALELPLKRPRESATVPRLTVGLRPQKRGRCLQRSEGY